LRTIITDSLAFFPKLWNFILGKIDPIIRLHKQKKPNKKKPTEKNNWVLDILGFMRKIKHF